MQTFKEYLEERCFDQNPTVLDDDMPDFFDNWEPDVEDVIGYAENWGKLQYLEGQRNQLQKSLDRLTAKE